YRAFSRELLEKLPLDNNSDDFIFDNQILAQILWQGHRIGEVSCPTKYFDEASSINFLRSLKYGLGCIRVAVLFCLARAGLFRSRMFREQIRDLE
ncbi:MAG: glycosyltransferase family 2 protein, partial [Candidatus Aminicenantes bacterium]|nr:glycosyltransferase family 2 protein [Candidatus Aminicenantes bacterium]